MDAMNFMLAPIELLTDSYKITHWLQYPPGTHRIFSFFESRGGEFSNTLFFGLQYYLKRYVAGQVVTEAGIQEAKEVTTAHFGSDKYFNEAGWRYILDHHEGRLPLEIRAIPEGTVTPTSNALMTFENTDPNTPWLPGHMETLKSLIWDPCTVAMNSYTMRGIIHSALERTGDPSLIDFKLHDFGFRGCSSVESAAIGGAAHLINFKGTDTLAAIMFLRKYYHEPMAGFSIPAAEHSTITSWGREHEVDAYRHMLQTFPTGLVAVVSDSYDIYNACENLWGGELRDMVLARDGVLVVRPDSGYPPEVVTKVENILGNKFGYSTNSKGYKVINPHVRIIQGDGIDRYMLDQIYAATEAAGWSADNLGFGSGGGLLQKVNRDTQKFAIKCAEAEVNGESRNVMKDPVTDPGKRSKAGHLKLTRDSNGYHTVTREQNELPNLLEPVFRNGVILRDQTFADIRQRAMAA